ncbi:hypothetical protein MmiHf6_07710 [Methanimicrococcus hongohii]|uniref:Uncharacterized protein n=1 Tax=Methanimicrococcus hongohii TaxID=3028295 RepID=A0AA96ZSI5_9EURY|nr:hypothetical protein [Methanimicrococcus sp. Hf6]WNY23464.1 hypothetical protein MmiHf6_07710 [Methanimicrococcus sp. Hf6]
MLTEAEKNTLHEFRHKLERHKHEALEAPGIPITSKEVPEELLLKVRLGLAPRVQKTENIQLFETVFEPEDGKKDFVLTQNGLRILKSL